MRFLPIIVFICSLLLMGVYFLSDGKMQRGLQSNSKLIDKPLPEIEGLVLDNSGPVVINLFASWCVSCLAEHGIFVKLKESYPNVTWVGINWRDKPEAMISWLQRYGNPYDILLQDSEGANTVPLGVKGIPETFIVNSKGVVIYKHEGPIDEETLSYALSQAN